MTRSQGWQSTSAEWGIDNRKATLYTRQMIKSFRHKGLEEFFRTGSKKGIQPHHAGKLRLILGLLNRAKSPADVNGPCLLLHALSGKLSDHWSVRVSGNWRVVFKFDGYDILLVDYLDYHQEVR